MDMVWYGAMEAKWDQDRLEKNHHGSMGCVDGSESGQVWKSEKAMSTDGFWGHGVPY